MMALRTFIILFVAVSAAALERSVTARGYVDDPEKQEAKTTTVIPDQTFDNLVFGNVRGATVARKRFQILLELQIDEVDRTCELSDAQKTTLQTAGEGDIKRYFDKVEEMHRRFQDVKADPEKFAELQKELQPLRVDASAGLFGDKSIFADAIPKTLTAEQAAGYEKAALEKRLFRHRAKISLVVTTLDNSLGMTAEQKRKLEKILVDQTRLPRESSRYDFYVILYQAALLPEETIKPILDETQWKSLTPYFFQAKRMGDFLKKGGYLPAGVGPVPEAEPKPLVPTGEPAEKKAG